MTQAKEPSEVTLHLAYAEASVVLIEALIELLIERKVLPAEKVIETLEMTIEGKRVRAQEGDHVEISRVAAGVLSTLANSIAAAHVARAEGAGS